MFQETPHRPPLVRGRMLESTPKLIIKFDSLRLEFFNCDITVDVASRHPSSLVFAPMDNLNVDPLECIALFTEDEYENHRIRDVEERCISEFMYQTSRVDGFLLRDLIDEQRTQEENRREEEVKITYSRATIRVHDPQIKMECQSILDTHWLFTMDEFNVNSQIYSRLQQNFQFLILSGMKLNANMLYEPLNITNTTFTNLSENSPIQWHVIDRLLKKTAQTEDAAENTFGMMQTLAALGRIIIESKMHSAISPGGEDIVCVLYVNIGIRIKFANDGWIHEWMEHKGLKCYDRRMQYIDVICRRPQHQSFLNSIPEHIIQNSKLFVVDDQDADTARILPHTEETYNMLSKNFHLKVALCTPI